MKNIIIVAVVLLIGLAGVQVMTLYKVKSDLGDQIEKFIDQVNETSANEVAQGVVDSAKKLGVNITPGNVQITYEDTDIQSYAQRVVGQKLGAQYNNKRVEITVRYNGSILGLRVPQVVSRGRIRQVSAPQIPPSREVKELLDSH